MSSPLDHCWYAIVDAESVGDDAHPFQVRDVSYVMWRTDQGLVAVRDRCRHREAKLSLGTVEDGCLRCPYHGWVFGDDGRCVEIPSSGPGATIPPSAHLTSLPVVERYGLVWFCPDEPHHEVPDLAVEDDSSFARLNTATDIWDCSVTRMIDNMLDVAHFPYTHSGTFGREQEQAVPNFTLEQLDDVFHGYKYSVVVNNEGEAKAMSGGGADVIQLDMSTGFALPYSVRSTMSYDNGIEQTLFMTATPMSGERSYFSFVLWRNDDVSATGKDIVDFELAVAAEDKWMLETLSGELPLARGQLADVQSDKASLEWRRRYAIFVSTDG
ncbi:MAG TPA: Rieske 2Fe-2S domain-containing protein [Ilumatobacter sp.]|nr:Rieske 2Fe-2S domain-containing protein [Ilumatobacter sp.]